MPETRKPQFKRQESWRLKRVPEAWRRPKGVTSRMRKEKAGWPPRVKIGYSGSSASRGLHPSGMVESRVERESDLERLDPRVNIVRLSARLGERKRLAVLEKARQLSLRVANPGKKETGVAGAEPRPEEAATSERAKEVSEPEQQVEGEESAAPEEGVP